MSITYKHGGISHVKLTPTAAIKYTKLYDTYWLKEMSCLYSTYMTKAENIITYSEVGVESDFDNEGQTTEQWFTMTMKKYPRTLADYVVYRDKHMIQIMLDLTSVLSMLHSMGIMHRDIKQSNVLVTSNDRVVLADFGHSYRKRLNLTELDSCVVTSYYRAPEVFQYQDTLDNVYDEKIDIWALGFLLLEKLTNRCVMSTLLRNPDDKNIKRLVCSADFPHVIDDYIKKHKRVFIYDEYIKWIKKMLVQDPTKRIDSYSLYQEILTFAKSMPFEIKIPNNTPVTTPVTKFTDYPANSAYDQLIITTGHIISELICSMDLPVHYGFMLNVMKYLIHKGHCQSANIVSMVYAVLIIYNTVYYDHVSDIKECLKNETRCSLEDVYEYIQLIIGDESELIFGNMDISGATA